MGADIVQAGAPGETVGGPVPMNGAESLVRTLVAGGVDLCFANPGTSEMHFVSALDRVDGMRSVLFLFEGGATGAADGYGRMADRPASTLLHLGPGLANGVANLHNARRARSPIVNIVGEHATYHRQYDSPLTSDIESVAGTVSAWVRTGRRSEEVAGLGAEAVATALGAPNAIATLILPADTAWGPGGAVAALPTPTPRAQVPESRIESALAALRGGRPAALFLGDRALRAEALAVADRIAAKTGCQVLTTFSNARTERGTGRAQVERVPYPVEQAVHSLAEIGELILVGNTAPVAFFAYPDLPSTLEASDCTVTILAQPEDDQLGALERLAEALGAIAPRARTGWNPPMLPSGALSPEAIGRSLAALLPEGAIVCDESITTGRTFMAATRDAAPHDWLQMTGGAIGIGIPLATGASIACPGRKVVTLQADGSGLYTAQALWTQAREKLDVVTLIWANRSYATLQIELAKVGAKAGRKALEMLSLDGPAIDWVSLAKGYGVEAVSVTELRSLQAALRAAMSRPGPFLIEVILP